MLVVARPATKDKRQAASSPPTSAQQWLGKWQQLAPLGDQLKRRLGQLGLLWERLNSAALPNANVATSCAKTRMLHGASAAWASVRVLRLPDESGKCHFNALAAQIWNSNRRLNLETSPLAPKHLRALITVARSGSELCSLSLYPSAQLACSFIDSLLTTTEEASHSLAVSLFVRSPARPPPVCWPPKLAAVHSHSFLS